MSDSSAGEMLFPELYGGGRSMIVWEREDSPNPECDRSQVGLRISTRDLKGGGRQGDIINPTCGYSSQMGSGGDLRI